MNWMEFCLENWDIAVVTHTVKQTNEKTETQPLNHVGISKKCSLKAVEVGYITVTASHVLSPF